MVKTRSTVPSLNMEGGLIIATEDNTEVYINGATTPIATLNAGKFYRIDETNYATQTTPGGTHSNMFISTTKNVYLYQFIGVGASDATNGFNYIPPLNCFLPRKIDEVGKINEMPLGSGGASITKSDLVVKLNILTEAGATVLVNNNPPLPSEGPFPLTGNTNWVTYGIPSVTGNITITSTKAVTAGINGGYSSAGYGGYFAGFSSIPFISKKTGECVPGIVLELDDGYETYQWFRNGTAVAGATANTYSYPIRKLYGKNNYGNMSSGDNTDLQSTDMFKAYHTGNQCMFGKGDYTGIYFLNPIAGYQHVTNPYTSYQRNGSNKPERYNNIHS